MSEAEIVPASEVRPGDVLVLPGYPRSTVRDVLTKNLLPGSNPGWPALHIQGEYNIIRFPHESVFRLCAPETSEGGPA